MDQARDGARQPESSHSSEFEHEPSLRLLLDRLNDVVWTATPDGARVISMSDACQTVYGRAAEEFLQDVQLWLKVVHPDDRNLAENSAKELSDHGKSTAEYRVVRPDGSVRWISDRKSLVRDEGGAAQFIGGLARDITPWYRFKQFIDVEQQMLADITGGCELNSALETLCRGIDEIMPEGVASVLLLDDDRQALRVAAAPEMSTKLKEILDGLDPGDQQGGCGEAVSTGQAVFISDTSTDRRWSALRDVARKFDIRACWSLPIFSADDQVLGTLTVASHQERYPSQSDRKLLKSAANLANLAIRIHSKRQSLILARETAERGTRQKSGFLAGVSHELRTPMTAIIGFAEELLEDKHVRALPPARIEDLRTIQRNGDHLLQLVNNLLDVSKIEAGKLVVEQVPCAPKQLAAETVTTLQAAAAEKEISLDVEYTLPIVEKVVSDPTRIRQILLNLVGNAVKFTKQGSVRLRVSCKAIEDTARLRFDVIDTGIGMNEEQCKRVFQPFVQADVSTTRRFGGSGLGLSLCRQLAERLNGRISVISKPGQGSTFTLQLEVPIYLEDARDVESADHPRGAATEATPPLAGRYLVVEDSPDNRRLLEFVLAKNGATVVSATNGIEACELVTDVENRQHPFRAILMDMQMPNMDGFTATRQLRAGGYSGPIIALTAQAMAGDRERCLNAGCDAFVTKPIDRGKLIRLLASLD